MTRSEEIRIKIEQLPESPGVYLMKDDQNKIIYVGKAKILKNRVKQYFQSSRNHTEKVVRMVSNIVDFEYIITSSETEALVLECNLIKKYRPEFNVMLKDSKGYPYVKITVQDKYPRVYTTRTIKKDGSKYFGPYVSGLAIKQTLEAIRKIYPVRSCAGNLENRKRPCLYYHIKQCKAPCRGDVDVEEYNEMIQHVMEILNGKHNDLLTHLNIEMQEASKALQFERAAIYRDRIAAIQKISENQRMTTDIHNNQDIIGLSELEQDILVQVLFVRRGKMIGGEHFILQNSQDETLAQLVISFIKQYYYENQFVPNEILIQETIEEQEVIEEWLQSIKKQRVYIRVPQRGDKRKLVEMAVNNASEAANARLLKRQREYERTVGAVEVLADALGIKGQTHRIEGYDISNIQGVESVASMVVFEDGKPARKQYRRFKIKTVEGPNDFASMAEVLTRRFERGKQERETLIQQGKDPNKGKFSKFPDIVLIDGGKGQLHFARETMRQQNVDAIPTFGLAKEFEEIYMEHLDQPIILDRNSAALHLIQRIRDEAHRFAITYHRSLRGKQTLKSLLEEIPGIGPKRRQALYKRFGSIMAIQEASLQELCDVEGMNHRVAENIIEFFKTKA